MANKIQVRRGTKAQLTALGALALGEPGYATDTGELYVGNGSGANTKVSASDAERTAWNAKASTALATSSAAGLMPLTDKAKLDSVLNPWGDNTTSSRSAVWAYRSGSDQAISAATWTTLIMNAESTDNLGEYNPATGIFTAKTAGLYLVHGKTGMLGTPTGTHLYLRALQNGTVENRFAFIVNSTGTADEMSLAGSVTVMLSANETLAIQLFSSSPTAAASTASTTRLEIVKIA